MPSRQRITWAYLAGFTDGDGCICISRPQTRSTGVRSVRARLAVSVRWGQAVATDAVLDAVTGLLEDEGVTYGDRHYVVGQTHPQREVSVHSRDSVLVVLRAIEPHLVLKQQKARDAIALLEEAMTPRSCQVAGCGGKYKAKGFCIRHYQAAWQREEVGHAREEVGHAV